MSEESERQALKSEVAFEAAMMATMVGTALQFLMPFALVGASPSVEAAQAFVSGLEVEPKFKEVIGSIIRKAVFASRALKSGGDGHA